MLFVDIVNLIMFEINLNPFYLLLKASEQIKAQTTKSSSIILALTDGKLPVYVHELTVNEVSLASLSEKNSHKILLI